MGRREVMRGILSLIYYAIAYACMDAVVVAF
jgi:hypothetical protein